MTETVTKLFLSITIIFSCSNLNAQGTYYSELWEYMEWEIHNPTYSGNPFDLIADVTFTHTTSFETIKTQMFYDLNDTWKFRFTGTKLGEWQYSTSSSDSELNGLEGNIIISENDDSNKTGFLTYVKNKYAIQVKEDSVKAFLFNVYMNNTDSSNMFRQGDSLIFSEFAQEAKDNGCSVIFSHQVANSWFQFPVLGYDEHSSVNPDPYTFYKLELMIAAAREKGVRVHIWAWGDESRKWTPVGVGGINGVEDVRLQRYIAARLGPIPGWTMGYAFDLHEWVTNDQVYTWAENLDNYMGWTHLLSARGIYVNLPNVINSYSGAGREVEDLTSTIHGPRNYMEIVEDIISDTTKPHLYEERHAYNRQPGIEFPEGWDLDMDGSRRLMWWEAMAGGFGGWFGYYAVTSGSYGGFPYPNPEQLQTHREFWTINNRFRLDLEIDSSFTDGYGLKSSNYKNYIVYKEETDSIWIDLNSIGYFSNIIAVDTKLTYNEIKINNFNATTGFWNAPYPSDWAIVIGDFDKKYVQFTAKIFLEGSFTEEQMVPSIDTNYILPKNQPFNRYPWDYNGSEIVSTLSNSNIIDWVLVEIRTDISAETVISRRAAFVKADGSIVDLDGISPVKFYNVESGNYYVAVHHRNHLSIMSNKLISLETN